MNTAKLICLLALSLFSVNSLACELVMGYRTNERLPLVNAAPDNEGLYKDLYSKAAEHIGCSLKIVRAPKKRILNGLRDGSIDFYPGFNYTPERAGFVHYINNGLPGGDIGVSHKKLKEVTQLSQLKGHSLAKAMGSPNFVQDIQGVEVIEKSELTTEKAVELVSKERIDFYIYNRDSLLYHLKTKKPDNIKIHFHCCGGEQPLYLGFSVRSKHFAGIENSDENSEKSVDRQTLKLSRSKALELQTALYEMKDSFETKALYAYYYD